MRRLLVLRPEPGSSATAERARAMGLEVDMIPLFSVEPIAWEAPDADAYDGLLLTSANALRHGGEKLQYYRGLPAHAVGEATAAAARQIGLAVITVGDAGVEALLASLEPDLNLLHLCGEDRRVPRETAQAVTPITVYRSRAVGVDLGDIENAVAMIHSPRAGSRFAALVDAAEIDRAGIAVAAISPTAAEAAGAGWAARETAERPDDEALLALAARLCNNLAGR